MKGVGYDNWKLRAPPQYEDGTPAERPAFAVGDLVEACDPGKFRFRVTRVERNADGSVTLWKGNTPYLAYWFRRIR